MTDQINTQEQQEQVIAPSEVLKKAVEADSIFAMIPINASNFFSVAEKLVSDLKKETLALEEKELNSINLIRVIMLSTAFVFQKEKGGGKKIRDDAAMLFAKAQASVMGMGSKLSNEDLDKVLRLATSVDKLIKAHKSVFANAVIQRAEQMFMKDIQQMRNAKEHLNKLKDVIPADLFDSDKPLEQLIEEQGPLDIPTL